MASENESRLGRWPTLVPFLVSAVILDLMGWFMMKSSPHPISNLTGGMVALCVISGAIISIVPFLWDAKAALRNEELDSLAISSQQIRNIQKIVDQITTATAQWMTVQEHSSGAVDAARSISKEMTEEAKRFSEFMAKAADREKATLKLEVDKLKRGEADWLQVVVVMLDHVHALYHAGLRSGQQNVINQLTNFSHACHEAARRVGLVPFSPNAGDVFDGGQHQWVKSDAEAPGEAKIRQTVAVGLSFQGQQIRKAVVELEGDETAFSGGPAQPSTPQLETEAAPVENAGGEELPLG